MFIMVIMIIMLIRINMITLIRALCQKLQHYREEENSNSASIAPCLEAADQHDHDDVGDNDNDGDDDDDDVIGVNDGDDCHSHLTLIQEVSSVVKACLGVDDCPDEEDDFDGRHENDDQM